MKLSVIILIIGVLMDSTSGNCPSSVNCPDAPYHITQPTDHDVQIVTPTATMLDLRCSLNVTIPANITITWSRNGHDVIYSRTTTEADTVTNTIRLSVGGRPQDGVYQCVFNDSAGYILRRNITVLFIQIVQPSMDFYTVTFDESTILVQLMCSLNINISSNVMVTWLHNGSVSMTTPPNEVLAAGSTTTLVIRNPQPSDAGVYQCVFNDTFDNWILTRNIGLSPYHVIQPPTNDYVQIVSTTVNVTLRCSLSVNIPANMTITWLHNGYVVESTVTQVDTINTVQLTTRPHDGVYQCVFNDAVGYILRRNITLLVVDVIQPPAGYGYTVTFDESTSCVQLMCSLNINISSNVTVTWLHNGPVAITPPNEVITTGNTTTLLIGNPQPSDTGDYMCVFTDTVNGWTLSRNIVLQESSITSTATMSIFSCAITSTASTSAAATTSATTTSASTTPASTTSTTTSTFTFVSSILSVITIPSAITPDATDETSSSSDVNVGVIVAPIIIIIVIALVVVAFIIAFYWWRRKKQLRNICETMLQTSSTSKQKPVHTEMNNRQDSKEPEYMEICKNTHSTKQTENVSMQNNPAYSISFEHQNKSVYSTKQADKVTMQDNPAYSIPSECQVEIQHNPAYSVSFATVQ